MKEFYVTLAVSISAEDREQAYQEVLKLIKDEKDFAIDIDESEIEEEPIRKIFTVIVENHDETNPIDKIMWTIEDLPFVSDVEFLEQYENNVRLQIETDGDIDFDYLSKKIEENKDFNLSVELISEDEYYDE